MKKISLKPLAILTFSAFTIYGCASSDQATDTAMSDTAVSGGQEVETLVVEEQVAVPIATLSVTSLPMENTIGIDEMFADIDDTKKHDVLALAKTNPNLTTFVKLVEQADIVSDLQRLNGFTLFAPTNEAFSNVPQEKLESLLMTENKPLLYRVLQAHILPSQASTVQIKANDRIRMSENSYIPINTEMAGTALYVGGAQVIKGDIEASNGMIHVVDKVILPSEDAREDTITR